MFLNYSTFDNMLLTKLKNNIKLSKGSKVLNTIIYNIN